MLSKQFVVKSRLGLDVHKHDSTYLVTETKLLLVAEKAYLMKGTTRCHFHQIRAMFQEFMKKLY